MEGKRYTERETVEQKDGRKDIYRERETVEQKDGRKEIYRERQ
jgi:hypothetical protein